MNSCALALALTERLRLTRTWVIEARKTKTKVVVLANHKGHRQSKETNQNSKQTYVNVVDAKCRKTFASKPRLVLALLLGT